MIQTIDLSSNIFKITKATLAPFRPTFEVQTPADYVKLRIRTEIQSNRASGPRLHSHIHCKMFEDAVKAGVEEFIRIVSEYCSEQTVETEFDLLNALKSHTKS